jgi:hypothetical protein
MRILLTKKAAVSNWEVWGDDALQAFLNARRPMYKPLHIYSMPCWTREALLLEKNIYGLHDHDSPLAFHKLVQHHIPHAH